MQSSAEKCIAAAERILTYADNTKKKLKFKLKSKGYSDDDIAEAIDFLTSNGFLNEERMLESAVRFYSDKKLFGESRIKKELFVKGFEREDIMNYPFEEIDFEEICYELFIKLGGEDDDKTKNKLRLYGHSYSDIKSAVSREEE